MLDATTFLAITLLLLPPPSLSSNPVPGFLLPGPLDVFVSAVVNAFSPLP